jgi:type I restriction enzyme, S subunit
MTRSTYALSEVVNLIGGGTPKRSETAFWNGDIPWLSVKDFNNDSRYIDDSKEYITRLGLEKSSTKILDPGMLVISARGTVGELAQLKSQMAFNQSCYGIDAISEYLENDYLYYLLKIKIRELKSIAHGSVFDTITRETFDKISVSIPPKKEQLAIVKMLGALDSKIELNQQINETLEEIAKTLFKSWFIDFDPVRAKAEGRPTGLSKEISDLFPDSFEDSELGEIPSGWKLSALSEVFDIQGGSQPPAKTFIDEEKEGYVRLLQIRDYDTSAHKTFIPIKKNLRIVDEDDVLIGRYGSGNGKFMEDSLGRPLRGLSGAINVAVVRTIPKLDNSREFIAIMVSFGLFYKWIVGGSARAVQAGFKKDDLDYIKLSVPSPEILSVFEEFGALIWARTKALRKENKILSELRDTLLPKLISGELKILDAENIVEEAGV